MISVITTTYKTDPNVLARTWNSLKSQTYSDWEWVVYDDSLNDDVYRQVYGFCSDERYVVRLFKPHVPSGGNIGLVKHNAFMLGHGQILVELDHDDELMPNCLQEIYDAFENNPSVGFVWSDCSEILPSGESGRYPDGWGLGFGSDYWDEVNNVWAMRVPMNRVTLSHIVSSPNHVRAWRASDYHKINGHNINLKVADDYDIILKTAIETECLHIPKMLYKQHIGPTTAQRVYNDEIQKLVPMIHECYTQELDIRFPS
jgi:glycosyltransferase involved in cell wall biosynthesis